MPHAIAVIYKIGCLRETTAAEIPKLSETLQLTEAAAQQILKITKKAR